jgi:hypothetical protein
MTTKICTKCGCEKSIDLFVVKSSYPDGHASECKECHRIRNREAYHRDLEKNRAKSRIHAKRSYQRHKEKRKEYSRRYAKEHPKPSNKPIPLSPEERMLRKKQYYENNKDRIAQYKKAYAKKNRERIRAYRRDYYNEKKDILKEKASVYYDKNRERSNARQRARMKNIPQLRIAHNLRTRISAVLKGRSKGGRLNRLVGCSMDFLKEYLESYFKQGMTWDNYGRGIGKWSLDHTTPLDHFNLEDENEQRKAFHYTNLRPMWYSHNASKGNRYVGDYKPY